MLERRDESRRVGPVKELFTPEFLEKAAKFWLLVENSQMAIGFDYRVLDTWESIIEWGFAQSEYDTVPESDPW
jgi:hypothetical protein